MTQKEFMKEIERYLLVTFTKKGGNFAEFENEKKETVASIHQCGITFYALDELKNLWKITFSEEKTAMEQLAVSPKGTSILGQLFFENQKHFWFAEINMRIRIDFNNVHRNYSKTIHADIADVQISDFVTFYLASRLEEQV